MPAPAAPAPKAPQTVELVRQTWLELFPVSSSPHPLTESKFEITAVVAHYPANCAPLTWRMATSGFSGARVYRLETARGSFALRRWPAEHPAPQRLTWIHSVLTHAVANGFDRLPLPIRTVNGRSFVRQGDHLWELAPWLPGEPDNRQPPNSARATAALRALAALHQSMGNFQPNPQPVGPSPGLAARLEQLRGLLAGGTATIRVCSVAPYTSPKRSDGAQTSQLVRPSSRGDACDSPLPESDQSPKPHEPPQTLAALRAGVALIGDASTRTSALSNSALVDAANDILSHFARRAPEIERRLTAAAKIRVPMQPAVRDIHGEHVLFVGDAVTGIIDFGAMRFDTVAGDIARLLGSLVQDDLAGWQSGLAAYEEVRPLSATERELVPVFDSSGVLLGAMNWLEWLFVEQRQFTNLDLVQARLAELLARLRA